MSAANDLFQIPTRTDVTRHMRCEISLETVARYVVRLMAAALIVTGIGLWIAPGAANLPELVPMKLCVSFFFTLVGVHLLFMMRTP